MARDKGIRVICEELKDKNESLQKEITFLKNLRIQNAEIRDCLTKEIDKLRNQVNELTEKNKALLKENIELLEKIRKSLIGD